MNRYSVARRTLDKALFPVLRGLDPGVVLDVGAKHAPYRSIVPCTRYMTLDLVPSSGADIVGDLHDVPYESNSIDTIIATEVLEHCYDPARAVSEMRRLLRPGGVCILTTRFIHPYHPDPQDYFRFTKDGLAYLFREFGSVEIRPLGNRLLAAWLLATPTGRVLGYLAKPLDPLLVRIVVSSSKNPCGYLVRAVR